MEKVRRKWKRQELPQDTSDRICPAKVRELNTIGHTFRTDPGATHVSEPEERHARTKTRGAKGLAGTTPPPQLSADYWFMGARRSGDEGSSSSSGCSAKGREDLLVLVVYEKVSKSLFGHRVAAKGPEPSAAAQLARDLDAMGYRRIVCKTDQEPAAMALIEAAKEYWSGEFVMEEASKGDKDSNGAAEIGVQVHQALTRTYKIALESRIGEEVGDESPVMAWICEWAALNHRRYKMGEDGRSAYERLYGKRAIQPTVEFGERVLAQPLASGSGARSNTQDRFVEGVAVERDTGVHR